MSVAPEERAVSKLLGLCRASSRDSEKIASYIAMLFLYHEEGYPLGEEVLSFTYGLSSILEGLGFGEETKNVIEVIQRILETYMEAMDALSRRDFKLRNERASEIRSRLKSYLESCCREALEKHTELLAKVLEGADSSLREALLRFREVVAKHAQAGDPQTYGAKVTSSDVSPLTKLLGDAYSAELFNVRGGYEATKLLQSLGIGVVYYWSSRRHSYYTLLIFPAFFSDRILSLLRSSEQAAPIRTVQAGRSEAALAPRQYSSAVKTREILEGIVASALRALGFSVKTNIRMWEKGHSRVEVDVWAEKPVAGTRFKVYVSCKNWNRDVGLQVVHEEAGRTQSLLDAPHLKVLIVKSMNPVAKTAAEASGFLVIELGEKATEENADAIYRMVYGKLSEIFTGLAPPRLREIALEVAKTAKSLEEIAHKLEQLAETG